MHRFCCSLSFVKIWILKECLAACKKSCKTWTKKKKVQDIKVAPVVERLLSRSTETFILYHLAYFLLAVCTKLLLYLTKKILQDWHLKQSRRNLCGTKKYRRFEHINSFIRAAIIGKAAFLDPDTDIEPYSFAPPTEKILAISVKYCWKVIYRIFGNVISFWFMYFPPESR